MPSRATTSLGGPKHLRRFIASRSGKTIEEIATEEGISVETVKNSIQTVEFKQGYHTNEFLTQTLIGIILKATPAAQGALLDALTASTRRVTKNEAGEELVINEPNYEVRLKAVEEFREIAKAAQPKPGHSTNVKVGVVAGVPVGGVSGSYVGLEERMRELQEKRKTQHILPPASVQAVILEAAGRDGEDEEDDE